MKKSQKKQGSGRGTPRVKDPFSEREQRRYERPIPSREAILACMAEEGGVMTHEEIAEALAIREEQDHEALRRRLAAMTRDGQIIKNRRGGYGLSRKMDLVAGRVIGHPDGFGFLKPDGAGEDLFLPPKQMRLVLHGDRVLGMVTKVDHRGRREGAVAEVLERANQQVVGRFRSDAGIGFVVPDEARISQDVLVPPQDQGKAKDGDMVVARVVHQPDARRQPVGKVVEVLGKSMDAGLAAEIALMSHGIPSEWPEEALDQARRVPGEVTPDQRKGREDLRDLPLVTIDGADAKDFDDAVYCEPTRGGYRLIVAIADVSSYVTVESPLDMEAIKRGTSVYFPERVVPMLPETLSNGICSLRPDVERLCMCCEMIIDGKGRTKRTRFFRGVMRSHARLTYDQVWAMLGEGDKQLRSKYQHVLEDLENLYDLFKALRSARQRRGAIDFDSKEIAFEFTNDGRVADIKPYERNPAHLIIEECMIAANVATAKFLEKSKVPAPFRVHAPPPEEKLENVKQFLNEIGLKPDWRGKPEPADFSRVMERARGRDDEFLIQQVLLRAQSLAVYQTTNEGHFGLALEAYTHFTSPIRRYADLLVHRAIGHVLDKGKPRNFDYTPEKMARLCESSSAADRRADEAARDVDDRLKCLWLSDHVGETFEGLVSGVTSFGLFIELRDTLVQGLVHVSTLPNDYYHFDPVHHRLTGEGSGRRWSLADKVRVTVARVDVEERKVDFQLAGEDIGELTAAPKKKKRRSRKKRGGKGKPKE